MSEKRKKTWKDLSERQRRRMVEENVRASINFTDASDSSSSLSDTDSSNDEDDCLPRDLLMSDSSSSSQLEIAATDTEIVSNPDMLENPLDAQSDVSEFDSCEYRYSSSNFSDIISLDDFENDDQDYFFNPEEAKKQECHNDVRDLILEHNIDHITARHIIQVMNKYTDHNLPSDPRTVLKTPRVTTAWEIEGGQYYHFGTEAAIKKIITDAKNSRLVYTNNIYLLVNIDGAPLHNSTTKGIWPIQVSTNLTRTVYVIGIFYGPGKPTNENEYLKMFVDDMKSLSRDGLEFLSETFTVSLAALICDAPAKAMILNTKGHSGYSCCPTCEVVGSRLDNVVCFPNGTDQVLRTDEGFRNLQYMGTYQRGQTMLNEIPDLGLVTHVPRDYMHLVCLGVTRKLVYLWKYGPLNIRLNNNQIQTISDRLETADTYMPTDFARRPRSFKYAKQWKATECRRFLLYDGPVILKDIIGNDKYDNFIKLHVAIRILADCEKVSKVECVNLANSLLRDFVESFEIVYGGRYVSYNIHNLLHLASDVKLFGCLDNFSAFRFESYIFFLKKLLRKKNNELSQIVRRCKELDEAGMNVIKKKKEFVDAEYLKSHRNGPLTRNMSGIQYKYYISGSYTIKCADQRNNCVILNDKTAVRCLNFVQNQGAMFIVGRQFIYSTEIFNDPVLSSDIGSFIAEEDIVLSSWNCEEIKTKACVIPYNEKFAIIPLLHL